MSSTVPILPQDSSPIYLIFVVPPGSDLKPNQIELKLFQIESALGENDALKVKVRELLEISFNLFGAEMKKRPEFYPDLYLKSVEKIGALYAPTPPKNAAQSPKLGS